MSLFLNILKNISKKYKKATIESLSDVSFSMNIGQTIGILGPNGAFQGETTDKGIKDKFNTWNKSVIDYVPENRLLVYKVKEGWPPLCTFLKAPIPNIPFPYLNKTKRTGGSAQKSNTTYYLQKDPTFRMIHDICIKYV